jgi:glycerol-3-phosphate dehydrogenase
VSVPLSDRAAAWRALALGYDVVIIGGGITGAGVALDAATRGYRVALLERADYAAGTSSRSTKLIHGGLRYLPQWQFGLVRESLVERDRLRRLAPHTVKPLPFVVPIYRDTRRPLGVSLPAPLRGLAPLGVMAGLWGYDLLSRTDLVHRRLSRDQAAAKFPLLRTDGLAGAFLYHDAQTDDVGLTHAVLATARHHGALTLNYAEVTAIDPGSPTRVRVRDQLSGATTDLNARHVVNAAGVWAEEVASLAGPVPFRIERSKGTHLVLDDPALRAEAALVIPETDDGRLAFAVPWHSRVVLGTTDEPYRGEPDGPTATRDEARYLLGHLNRYLRVPVADSAVIAAFAGLRPLLRRSRARSSALSRHHEVVEHHASMVSIIGGKLTTYRQMAEDTIDVLTRRDGGRGSCRTRDLLLHDNEPDILELTRADPALSRPLVPGLPARAAHVVYACRAEQCVTLHDFMMFRSHLAVLDRAHGIGCLEEVGSLMAHELGWSNEERVRQIATYRAAVERENAFLAEL